MPLCLVQEIGFCQMRVGDGVNSRLQLTGLLANLCKLTLRAAS
jgi:replication factor C subunit 2/4